MDFELKPEQEQLRDMLQRYVRKDYGFEARRKILAKPEGFSRDVWAAFAELGLLGIGIPEEHGGMGGDAVDTLVVMEALGSGLVVEPYLTTVVVGAGLVRDAGSAAQKSAVLPKVAAGETLIALAHDEPGSRYELDQVATTAKKTAMRVRDQGGEGGRAARRLGRQADRVGEDRQRNLPVPHRRQRTRVTRKGYPTRDNHRAADISLADVAVGRDALLGAEGDGCRHPRARASTAPSPRSAPRRSGPWTR
jgi:alkylation response protein AidB-like acyl-CoA dehydrogenase